MDGYRNLVIGCVHGSMHRSGKVAELENSSVLKWEVFFGIPRRGAEGLQASIPCNMIKKHIQMKRIRGKRRVEYFWNLILAGVSRGQSTSSGKVRSDSARAERSARDTSVAVVPLCVSPSNSSSSLSPSLSLPCPPSPPVAFGSSSCSSCWSLKQY